MSRWARRVWVALKWGYWRHAAFLLTGPLGRHLRRWARRRARRIATGKGIWITGNGRRIHVTKMDKNHLKNALEYITRRDDWTYFDKRWVDLFNAEIERRAVSK